MDKDIVIFRKWKDTGEVIAFLPTEPANYGMCLSYMHIGQHGESDYYHLLDKTIPANPEEYNDLLQELISIGYDPDIKKKMLYNYVRWGKYPRPTFLSQFDSAEDYVIEKLKEDNDN